MAKGYINLPEKTAETFEKLADGSILYHTGDVVELGENGNYIYKNRLDWMVKINGQRVETLEIENVIKECDEVENAAVKAFVDDDGQNYLCAYFVGSNEADVRRFIAKKLPPYMIPRFFVKMSELPRNLNGKLDRTVLTPPSVESYKADFEAPTNDNESALCTIFDQILHCGKVGINDDFFALGGDSIKVMKLVAEIESTLKLTVTTKEVFQCKTIRNIAAALHEKDTEIIDNQDVTFVPLSEAQRGVYLECVENPESMMYNIPFVLELPKDIDIQRFAEAVNTAAKRHPSLFATFVMKDGEPVMKRGEIKDVVTFTTSSRENFVRPFNLENGPLYRFEINGNLFLLDVHHLVFDGTSMSVLLSQIADIYDGKDIADEVMTAFGHTLNEQNLKDTDDYRQAREFFKSQLEGIEIDLPVIPDVANEMSDSLQGEIVCMKAPESLRTDVVEHFVRQSSITENVLFMSAFAYTLATFSDTKESYFTTASNGRRNAALVNTVGMFVKMLPMHVNMPESDATADLLENMRQTFLQTLENDCISFGELVQNYGVNNDINFVYQSELLSEVTLGGTAILPEELPVNDCQSKLICMVLKTAEGYKISLH